MEDKGYNMEEFVYKPEEDEVRITSQDVLALMIASFQVMLPMALAAGGVMALLIFLLLKFFSR